MRLAFCFFVVCSLASLWAGDFKAGAARVDITPPLGRPLEGFPDRKGPASGVLDPLSARVLVLETKDDKLAMVTLDLCMMFGSRWIEALREKARNSSGISHLVVAVTHTHSGPVLPDQYAGEPGWETETLEKVARAIEEAHGRAVQARLGTGYGKVDAGYNRRRVLGYGNVEMVWENPARTPLGPVDPRVAVLRIDSVDGRPIAILVNHALHPVVFGIANHRYSADFVAPMTRAVESSAGGAAVCLFLQGGCGDINPYDADVPGDQDPPGKRDRIGSAIGEEAARVAKSIQTQQPGASALQVVEDVLAFRPRWSRAHLQPGSKATKAEYRAPVSVILIDKRIALMTMPGEPFVEFQLGWKARCPLPDAFFIGYANGYLGYFPTIRAAAEGGYGASDEQTYLEPGAGERMLDNALIRLYEMLGGLRNLPRPWND